MVDSINLSKTLSGFTERARLALMALLQPKRFGVTVVVTSCNRFDLLDQTLESFFKYNRFPIFHTIIVEDGAEHSIDLESKYRDKNIEWISTGKRVGQIAAIDYAYSRVNTPYIFHMEDDWEFFRSGFISKSMEVLVKHPKCLQVYLRAHDDTNNHPIEPTVYCEKDVLWQKMAEQYINNLEWNGFSFNPGLKRTSDYVLTNGYGAIHEFDHSYQGRSESEISKFYKRMNYYAGIFSCYEGTGYVRHIGDGRRVATPT